MVKQFYDGLLRHCRQEGDVVEGKVGSIMSSGRGP
jgi:hypothetical protein